MVFGRWMESASARAGGGGMGRDMQLALAEGFDCNHNKGEVYKQLVKMNFLCNSAIDGLV
jgi:hypothetical protein